MRSQFPKQGLIHKSIAKIILKSFFLSGTIFNLGFPQRAQASSNSIVAVEPLVCDLVKAISLPSQSVTCLIDRKVDVHDIKISPKQAQTLSSASQIITLGQEMTPSIRKWLKKPQSLVVGVSAIEIIEEGHHDEHSHHEEKHSEEEPHDEHAHHLHGRVDPHVWHNPINTQQISDLIFNGLRRDFPVWDRTSRKSLAERYIKVKLLLTDLDQWTKNQVSTVPIANRWIVSKHKAMGYFADRYGFETLSLLDTLGHSGSLRPHTISKVVNQLKKGNIPILFPEQKPPSKLLRNLSRQSSIPLASKPIYVDGLMPAGNAVSVAVHNTCTIVNSLAGSCNKKTGQLLESRWDSLLQ